MPAPKIFHFTPHARGRGRERSITPEQFQAAVLAPDTKQQQYRGTHGGIVYLFGKDFAGRKLNVVAEVYKDECWFVTGFWA